MSKAKKDLIQFIKRLPGDFSREDLIMAIVTDDLRTKGFTDTDFEEIRNWGLFPGGKPASH